MPTNVLLSVAWSTAKCSSVGACSASKTAAARAVEAAWEHCYKDRAPFAQDLWATYLLDAFEPGDASLRVALAIVVAVPLSTRF